jgi:hypothetical protein
MGTADRRSEMDPEEAFADEVESLAAELLV